jgi:hypothetical protein
MDLEQIENLYEEHDELLENPIRLGDRTDVLALRRLFKWQFTEYYRLLGKCFTVACEDTFEFKTARRYLRNAEELARGEQDLRLATARAEIAIQYIHKWLERVRTKLRMQGV